MRPSSERWRASPRCLTARPGPLCINGVHDTIFPIQDYYLLLEHGDPKSAANWVMGEVLATVNATNGDIAHFSVRPADLASLLELVKKGTVSHTAAA